MTAQFPLWTEPSLPVRFPVGTPVRSTYTTNVGYVVGHDERRILVHWSQWLPHEPDGFECWHSSSDGLEVRS